MRNTHHVVALVVCAALIEGCSGAGSLPIPATAYANPTLASSLPGRTAPRTDTPKGPSACPAEISCTSVMVLQGLSGSDASGTVQLELNDYPGIRGTAHPLPVQRYSTSTLIATTVLPLDPRCMNDCVIAASSKVLTVGDSASAAVIQTQVESEKPLPTMDFLQTDIPLTEGTYFYLGKQSDGD